MPELGSPDVLVSKVKVVDRGTVRFENSSEARFDSWEIDWEVTPPPVERAKPQPPRSLPPTRLFGVGGIDLIDDWDSSLDEPPPAVDDLPANVEPGGLVWSEDGEPPTPAFDTLPIIFEGLGAAAVQSAIEHFDVFEASPGDILVSAGENLPALVMVLSGWLDVERGAEGRRAGSGEVLGLTALFGTGVWPTTVQALTPARLLVLELDGYRALRRRGSMVSVTIEEVGAKVLLDALIRARTRFAELSRAVPTEQVVPTKGFFQRVAEAFGAGGLSSVNVDIAAILAACPLFRNASQPQLVALAAKMRAVRAQPGEFLRRQGDVDQGGFGLVVSGSVDVLTQAGPAAVIRHETLGAGSAFGAGGVSRGGASLASVVVAERAIILELDRLAWAEMAGHRDGPGSVLRLALLRSLTDRLGRMAEATAALEGREVPVAVHGEGDGRFLTINPIDRR